MSVLSLRASEVRAGDVLITGRSRTTILNVRPDAGMLPHERWEEHAFVTLYDRWGWIDNYDPSEILKVER